MKKVTYKKSGVDIGAAGEFKKRIKSLVRRSFRPEVLADIGGFGSLFRFQKNNFRNPVLVSSTDGVGTKLKIAQLLKKHDTVGIDLVAMNVNDILCSGAESLFFLDYIACSKLEPQVLHDVVKGINNGCIEAGCSLIGGETAQMPGMYKGSEYDLAGFCVGVVERDEIINGSGIEAGNSLIGIESNGLHSNGYSLVRRVFSKGELERLGYELLKPTKIYVKPVLSLLKAFNNPRFKAIRGISHITGGAFYDKISRILPANVDARINKNSWMPPKIFHLIQNKGNIDFAEMYRTLNMGIGMVLIVEPGAARTVVSKLEELKLKAWVIGDVVPGKGEVVVE